MNKQSDLNQVGLIQGGGASLAQGFRDLRVSSASDQAGDQPQTVGFRQITEMVADETRAELWPARSVTAADR